MDPHAPVVVTVRDIWEELVRLRSSVERLVDRGDAIAADVADHETRIRVLEKARWPLPSLAVLVSIAALAVTVLANVL